MNGKQIKYYRQKLGMSQEQFSKEIGFKPNNGGRTVRAIESGKNNISGVVLQSLRKTLKLRNIKEDYIHKEKT